MLIIEHLIKKYRKTVAVNDVNLTLEPGTITVLLGPNGAGKSTLIKSISGLLKYEGTITINGYPNKSNEARAILGYVAEIPALYPNLTVAEHMEFVARVYNLKNYQEYSECLLDRFELTDKKNKYGDELSKGMQQKLNICLGLLSKPSIILFDEPMIGLDPHAIKEVKKMMEELKAEGKTVLISTHIIDSVDMLWDRTIVMKNGSICADVKRNELNENNESLEKIFFETTEDEKQNV